MNMKNLATKGDSAKSVFHETTYQTSIGQQYTKARIKPIQQQDPTEDTTTPAAPTEVEGPPSSHLRSKTKQQQTSNKQEQPECNPTLMDPPECNPAEIEVNSIDITPKSYSWMRLTKFLSYSGKTIDDPAPVSLPQEIVMYSMNFVPFHPTKKQPSL